MGNLCCGEGRDNSCGPADEEESAEFYEYTFQPPATYKPAMPPLGRSASELSVSSEPPLPPTPVPVFAAQSRILLRVAQSRVVAIPEHCVAPDDDALVRL